MNHFTQIDKFALFMPWFRIVFLNVIFVVFHNMFKCFDFYCYLSSLYLCNEEAPHPGDKGGEQYSCTPSLFMVLILEINARARKSDIDITSLFLS